MKPYRIRQLAETPSTNDDAKQAAETGEPEGLVIHALKQTAGRGRHGRQWDSPEGNLYCSVLLRLKGERRDFGLYSFIAALALGETVQKYLPNATVTLKWPNDVLVDGKKISGILLESGEDYLVIGMGLNVRHHPENALYPTTSMVINIDLKIILETLLDRLFHWHQLMQQQGFAPVRAAWLANAHKGRMTVKLPDEELEGEFADLSAEGHLRLRLANDSERVIATGDVFFGD